MDLGSILLILALFIATTAFVAYPVLERKTVRVGERELVMSALLADRDRLLDSLLDLDFDQDMGKVSETLYAEQRTRLLKQAAEVMAQLDEYLADSPKLETMLEDRKAGKSTDTLDEMIAARRGRRSDAASANAKFCPDCGEKLQPGDKFCVSCGARI